MASNPIDMLERALTSPDPTIRNMAIRRRTAQVEVDRLDSFFSVYFSAQETAPSETVKEKQPRAEPAADAKKPAPKDASKTGNKASVLIERTVALLKRSGRPLRLAELCAKYIEAHGGIKSESLRLALFKGRPQVSLDSGLYWIAGVPVPQTKGGADA